MIRLWDAIKVPLLIVVLLLLWAAGRAWINEYRMIQRGQEVSLVGAPAHPLAPAHEMQA